MYKSNIISYLTIKYFPLAFGIVCLIIALWFMIDPDLEVTVNGGKRDAVFSDSFVPLTLGLVPLFIYFVFGQRIVRMKMNNNELKFKFKGEEKLKLWNEVESIKKFWLAVPPLYSVKFENDKTIFLFNTSLGSIVTPVKVFDYSEMGNFIKERKKDIPFLKDLKIKNEIQQKYKSH
jgi:hypothetical protein